jgi:hypothetical protein
MAGENKEDLKIKDDRSFIRLNLKKKQKGILLFVLFFMCFSAVSPTDAAAQTETNNPQVDIGLFNPECGKFEVRLRPATTFEAAVSNIQFTLKWPANTVSLTDFESDFNLEQQGPTLVEGDFNYAVFATVPPTGVPANWEAGEEIVILSFRHDQSGSGLFGIGFATGDWAENNNGLPYVEMLGSNATGQVYNEVEAAEAGPCNIDIGLFNSECGKFDVRLRPATTLEAAVSNIQFTLKWPANTVSLINFESDFNLEKQGPTVVDGDFNYAVFATVPPTGVPASWEAGEEIVILSFNHDQSGSGQFDMGFATGAWAENNNGLPYVELNGTDYTGTVYNQVEGAEAGGCNRAFIRVILQGACATGTGQMQTILNAAGLLPAAQPYNTLPWNYPGAETAATMPDTIVDWVLVEIRDATDPTQLAERKAGLLSQTGKILDTNFTDGIPLAVPEGEYYIVVKHRNHLPVMSGEPVSLPTPSTNPYDFTEMETTQPYQHNNPLKTMLAVPADGSGKWAMIAGNVNADGMLRYNGEINDRDPIIKIIQDAGNTSINAVITNSYQNEDINMNNIIMYNGPENDRDIIVSNLLRLTGNNELNTTYITVVPQVSDAE